MSFFVSQETSKLLNAVGENIFVTDLDFTIQFINHYSDVLIETIKPFTGIESKEQYIGMNMDSFHRGREEDVRHKIESYPSFPYETTLNLFGKFTARIVINPFEVDGQRKGYVLTWADVTSYEAELRNSEYMLQQMYTPVLQTILDDVVLFPIVGILTESRFESMKGTIMEECERRNVRSAIFDFTGMKSFDDVYLLKRLSQLSIALKLQGTETLISGVQSKVADQISQVENFQVQSKIFRNLKEVMLHLLNERCLEVVKK